MDVPAAKLPLTLRQGNVGLIGATFGSRRGPPVAVVLLVYIYRHRHHGNGAPLGQFILRDKPRCNFSGTKVGVTRGRDLTSVGLIHPRTS